MPTVDGSIYRTVVRALQYAIITRPYIAYSMNKERQFMQCSLDIHWKAVKRILRYLARTPNYGLHLIKSAHLNITGFSNSDWALDIDDHRSTTGYYNYVGQNLISQCSKKEDAFSRSST